MPAVLLVINREGRTGNGKQLHHTAYTVENARTLFMHVVIGPLCYRRCEAVCSTPHPTRHSPRISFSAKHRATQSCNASVELSDGHQ